MNALYKFQLGDTVEAFGLIGTVSSVSHSEISVYFNTTSDVPNAVPHFTLAKFLSDGKLHKWHKNPSLVLLESKDK